jgi:PTH1 family peptidyl-tRNA hydrolase
MPDTSLNMGIRLIIGLGNPGKEYAQTRHNVGFMVLDDLARRWGIAFSQQKKWQAEAARHGEIHLLKPQTYMNLSGVSAAACAAFFKIKPEQILVIYDEVALPLGKLRLRPNGSAGGHNGMKSLIQHLGSDQFPRIRLGIGGAEKSSLSGHVLGKFSEAEQDSLNKMLDRAANAVIMATLRDWASAMNSFNVDPKPPAPVKPPQPTDPAANKEATPPSEC